MSFEIKSIETIMDEFDYLGVRVHMEGKLDNLKHEKSVGGQKRSSQRYFCP